MSAFSVITVSPEGDVASHVWDVDQDSLLPALQRAVDGLVDVVPVADDLNMWVNDCGMYTESVNPLAGVLVALLSAPGAGFQPYYFGSAVFTGGADDEGNTLPLPEGRATQLLDLIARVCHSTAATS